MGKTIKERLAEKVNRDLDFNIKFLGKDFHRNHQASLFNDQCCWEACNGSDQIYSYETMTSLATQKEPLLIIGDRNEIGPKQIT